MLKIEKKILKLGCIKLRSRWMLCVLSDFCLSHDFISLAVVLNLRFAVITGCSRCFCRW